MCYFSFMHVGFRFQNLIFVFTFKFHVFLKFSAKVRFFFHRASDGRACMKIFFLEKNGELDEYFITRKEKKKLIYFFISGSQKWHWLTSKSMQTFLVTFPYLYKVNNKTVPPGESRQCTKKTEDT